MEALLCWTTQKNEKVLASLLSSVPKSPETNNSNCCERLGGLKEQRSITPEVPYYGRWSWGGRTKVILDGW